MPRVGDLVHVPQAVELIDHSFDVGSTPQLRIPLRVITTRSPTVGVVTALLAREGYIRIFCDGRTWSVKPESLYELKRER